MAQSFRVLRKFCSGPQPLKTRICSRQDAKNAKFGIGFPFATFASLREIFRLSVAALPRWDLRGEVNRATTGWQES